MVEKLLDTHLVLDDITHLVLDDIIHLVLDDIRPLQLTKCEGNGTIKLS